MLRYDPRNLTTGVDEMLASTTNPRHWAILKNYRRHALFEVTGNWQHIMQPDMIVEHPVYRLTEKGQTLVVDGIDAVSAAYRGLAESGLAPLFGPIEEHWAVADWGFAMRTLVGHQLPGRAMEPMMHENVDDVDAYYNVTHWYGHFWYYDEGCRLIGENIMEDTGSRVITKLSPSEVITPEEAMAIILPAAEAEIAELEAERESRRASQRASL